MEKSKEILQKAIGIEEFGAYYYSKLGKAVENRKGQALLTYLANAEREHRQTLKNMLAQYGGEPKKTTIDALISDIILNEGIRNIFRDLMKKPKLKTMDAIEAVKLGIEMEKKSMDFYGENAKKSDETEIKELFNRLSSMEKEHLEILEENLRNLEVEGVWYGYVPILEG